VFSYGLAIGWAYTYIGMPPAVLPKQNAYQLFATREWLRSERHNLIQNVPLLQMSRYWWIYRNVCGTVEEMDGYDFTSFHTSP
jgi:hypothetical protein